MIRTIGELSYYLRKNNWDIITMADTFMVLDSDGNTLSEDKILTSAIEFALETQNSLSSQEKIVLSQE